MAYREKRFCAFCKNSRTYYLKRDISFFDFVGCALASLAVMALVWQDFNIKVFYFFVFSITTSEILVRLRWRMKVICDFCGFDPILYKRDSKSAAEKVSRFLELRKTDSGMLLKPYPKLAVLKRRAVDPFLASRGAGKLATQTKVTAKSKPRDKVNSAQNPSA